MITMSAPVTALSKKIRTLMVEDNPDDAELNVMMLKAAGFELEWWRVETEADFLAAIETAPDLIVSDYDLPHFNGMRAVELLRARKLDIPFILVSGAVGEDIAVQAIKRGADDYLLKDRLARLGVAATQALQNHRLRAEQRRAEAAQRVAEERLRQAEKFASLGQLAASVARDLNPIRSVAGGGAPGADPARDFTRLLENYEKLLEAAKGEAASPELIAGAETARAQVNERVLLNLCQLLIALSDVAAEKTPAAAAGTPGGADSERQPLYAALEETIQVLEQTKRSFKSRSLGQLRTKLEKLVRPNV
jgi:CheY-like chemotaxis protein